MVRTTVMLPAGLKAKALRRADQLGVSFGELVRKGLETVLEDPGHGNGRGNDLLDLPTFHGPKGVSSDLAGYLYGGKRR